MRREDAQVIEIGAVSHPESEIIADEEHWHKKDKSIIKPKRRVDASSLDKEIDLGG